MYARLLGFKTVGIINPVLGGATRTSGKSAARHYRNGRVDVTDDFQILFLESAKVVERRELHRVDAEIERFRSGVVYWNGSGDPLAKHRPGEARS